MKKNTIFISKIRGARLRDECYFWYQVNHGAKRDIITGTRKEVTEKREALIEEYKLDHIKLGT